jgi:response regulator RpfG family c-di-GMP phosphodiesterase
MLAGRTYFAKMKLEDVIVNLHQKATTHFDPMVVNAFFRVLDARPEVFEVQINGAERKCLANYRQKMKLMGGPFQPQMFI